MNPLSSLGLPTLPRSPGLTICFRQNMPWGGQAPEAAGVPSTLTWQGGAPWSASNKDSYFKRQVQLCPYGEATNFSEHIKSTTKRKHAGRDVPASEDGGCRDKQAGKGLQLGGVL